MKYAGMISLIFSTTSLGLLLSDKSKRRIAICHELVGFCDLLIMELGFSAKPISKIIESTCSSERFSHIDFINVNFLVKREKVSTPLTHQENEEISDFIYSLGKSDVKSQLRLVEAFREYMKRAEEKYIEKHKKDSRLFISFGFFSGAVISLMFL